MSFSPLPADYSERVHGGVLGKVIGVYLGRPFEQWPHEKILERLGEIDYYVHDKLGQPLVVADDDISGTFTFLRALEDNDFDPNLTPRQIGETWLNYIIENRTILWWGGRSTSTEHTAFLNLKAGVEAPRSGSIEQNGRTVAEQIGAQIFIDGWGLIHPGDPEAAADWARRAASVSHDGEAIYGAQVIAAMVAGAFGETDIFKLQEMALWQIPKDCLIRRLVEDVRELVAKEPDWRIGFQELDARYGYANFQGECHIVPNHGLIHFALLHGKGSFRDSMRVVNTCGWDTDCNAGNLGCILGVRNGPQSLEADEPSWVDPFKGRVILPTADGGGYVTSVTELSDWVHYTAMRLRGEDVPKPSRSATAFWETGEYESSLRTFASPEELGSGGYGIQASPFVYPGQEVEVCPWALDSCRIELFARCIGADGKLIERTGPRHDVSPNTHSLPAWTLPGPTATPIYELGIRLADFDDNYRAIGPHLLVSMAYFKVKSVPRCTFERPQEGGNMWLRQWVNGLSELRDWNGMDCVQNEGTGLAIVGCREWQNYRVSSVMKVLASKQAGIAAHVQGMRRYYALVLEPGKLKLIKARDGITTLAEMPYRWEFDETQEFALEVQTLEGKVRLKGSAGGLDIEAEDGNRPLAEGAIGIVVSEGRVRVQATSIAPLTLSE